MFHKINILILLVLGVSFIGCRACYSPYDRCQPTFVPERGDQCRGELYRSGSVFLDPNHEVDHDDGCKECGGVSGNINDYKPASMTSSESLSPEDVPENHIVGKALPISPANIQNNQVNSPLWSLSSTSNQDMNAVNEFNLGNAEN